jgi:O-antigen ligase
MLIQVVGIELIFTPVPGQNPNTVTGFMDSGPLAGAYTAMTLPLFFVSGGGPWVFMSMLAIMATKSLGAVVVAVGLIIVWMLRAEAKGAGRKIIPWLAALACVGILVAYSFRLESIPAKLKGEQSNRILVWKYTGHLIKDSARDFIVGHSPGQFAREFPRKARRDNFPAYLHWEIAHNDPLQLWFEMGFIGLALGIWICAGWLRAGWKSADPFIAQIWAIFIGWLMTGLYYFPGHVACLAVVAVVAGGILEGAKSWTRSTDDVCLRPENPSLLKSAVVND